MVGLKKAKEDMAKNLKVLRKETRKELVLISRSAITIGGFGATQCEGEWWSLFGMRSRDRQS